MRLHRFYTNKEIGAQKEFEIDSTDFLHQVKNVFRLRSGDELIVFDGSGSDYVCRIAGFGKGSVTLDVESVEKSRFMPKRDVVLYASIVKKDNFEWIVEKATELGVTKIVPVISERSEKKSLNMERLRKIATEASEQSGRGDITEIGEIQEFSDCIAKITDKNSVSVKNIVAFHTESDNPARLHLAELDENDSIAIFIGPEGGWSLDEIDMFTKSNINIVSLGDQVLRAETAVVAALSLVLLS